MAHSRLGECLVGAGMITLHQLDEALGLQRESADPRPRLGTVIVEHGFASEEAIAQALADQLGLGTIHLDEAEIDSSLAQLVPQRIAHQHQLVPVELTPDRLMVAMADPTNLTAVDDVKAASGIGRFEVRVASMSAIRSAIAQLYSVDMAAADALSKLGITSDIEVVADNTIETEDAAALERDAQAAPVIRLVNAVLGDALRARATDVHIEPHPTELKIRYRVDGLLRDAMSLPKHVQPSVISRLKIISGMDIAERRRPQDGRNRFIVDGQELDTRVATMPTMWGEKVVVRLLNKKEEITTLESLGMEPEQLSLLQDSLDMPQGLIVFTGPTGAGKTSTMYAALGHLMSTEKNLVTLEDPIEVQVPGINQVQINERAGITFARGLRSLLRQDPDVVMVGEIRDVETAQMVIQASFTGHLALSSLHTKDAPGALTRLADLGVEPFHISSAVTMVVAQRLVRVICEHCKVASNPSQHLVERLGIDPSEVAGSTFYEGRGCERCDHSGFRGRTGIYEVLPVTTAVREQLVGGASEVAMARAARATGMSSLVENGLRKARAGITSLEEVHRVLYIDRVETPKCPNCERTVAPSFTTCPHCRMELSEEALGAVHAGDVSALRVVG